MKHYCETYINVYIKDYISAEASWWWSYDSWIYNYQCNGCCLSPLKLCVRTPFMVRCTGYNIMW